MVGKKIHEKGHAHPAIVRRVARAGPFGIFLNFHALDMFTNL